MTDGDLRRDKLGHYQGCVYWGCAATRCRESLLMFGLKGVTQWLWSEMVSRDLAE